MMNSEKEALAERLLYVSDEELLRRLRSGALTALGQEVARAELAQRAIPVENIPIDVVRPEESASVVDKDCVVAQEPPKTLYRSLNQADVDAVCALLRSEGIPAVVLDGGATLLFRSVASGGLRVQVPASCFEDSLALLRGFESGSLQLEAEETAETKPVWSLWKKILFAFLCLYMLNLAVNLLYAAFIVLSSLRF